jgi:hypothetical protein
MNDHAIAIPERVLGSNWVLRSVRDATPQPAR